MKTVLPNTTLTAIVRDELINPAGGIEDFARCHFPYIEQVIIGDTGSEDGTREILEELESQYPNLTVVDIPFYDFAHARNLLLTMVDSDRILVLDADERMSESDLQSVSKCGDESFGIDVGFWTYFEHRLVGQGHNPRYFNSRLGLHYRCMNGKRAEYLCSYKGESIRLHRGIHESNAVVHHFGPRSSSFNTLKYSDWYLKTFDVDPSVAPSKVSSFSDWKAFNPLRNTVEGLPQVEVSV